MDPSSPSKTGASTRSRFGPADGRWSVADLIDFDDYVDQDERTVRENPAIRRSLAERDRALYLGGIQEATAGVAEHSPKHRSLTLRLWLSARRTMDDEETRARQPGQLFARGQRLVTIGLGVAGVLIGMAVAAALLNYDGHRPVNVAWFVALLVVFQLALAALTATLWMSRRSTPVRGLVRDFSLLSHVMQPLLTRAMHWTQRGRAGGAAREAGEQTLIKQGQLQSHYALYGSASYLPLLIPAQVFGVAFNIGAVLATVALVWFTDLAFGWGSALDIRSETVHEIARLIALPWSPFFGEGVGYPSLAQVAGSRIQLKDPLFIFQAEHLRSWRWFLVLSLVTYGLLPRLLLLAATMLAQRRALARLPFSHARTQGLYARMITPNLEAATTGSGIGPAMPIPAAPVSPVPESPTAATATPTTSASGIPADACVLLVHIDVDELLDTGDRPRLERLLRQHTGWRVARSGTFGGSSQMTKRATDLIGSAKWQSPPPRIVLIQDGTQPPITESLSFLRTLRGTVGPQGQIVLLLVGDATEEDRLPPLSDFDFADWQRKIDQMGDPYLRLEMLAPTENGVG
ncbi:DUF2868 domain-containing protein [Thioalkalicoccus limnaeus]|uniref:DUF2868 domain-containing protein n=1 Tax=Thioalkalicoccus limnaeus TaxID=120681 RepID=A0ABV4BJ54_9GAMM